jgi:hypothetical protein
MIWKSKDSMELNQKMSDDSGSHKSNMASRDKITRQLEIRNIIQYSLNSSTGDVFGRCMGTLCNQSDDKKMSR